MTEPSSQIHQFADITVDAMSMRVLKGSEPVALEPKSFKVLLYLLENRDRLVTKEELLKSVWQDTFVSDNALTRTIAQIRKALGDDAKQGRIIETVPRLGYRFVGTATPSQVPSRDETVMKPQKGPFVKRLVYVAAVLLALAGGAVLMRPKPPGAVKLTRSIQFTTSSGLDTFASFSPDGSSLAYSSDRSGSFEVYVKPLSRGDRVIQVTSDGRQNVQPAWSPDGKYIAYHSVQEDGIWVVPAVGGSPRKLSDWGNAPAWSPDGKRLVFHDRSLTSMSAADQSCQAPAGNIGIVGLDGGAPRQVPLPYDSRVCQNVDPSWTPDGRVLLARRQDRFSQVVSIAPDGSGMREVERLPLYANSMRWLPERNSIYYSNYFSNGDDTIMRLPVDASGKRTGPPEEVVGNSASVPQAFAVSADGRRLAYTATLPQSQIDSLPLKGFRPAGPPITISRENIYRHGVPFISPDGQHMAFTGIRKGSNWDVWVTDIDGGNARLVSVTESGICFGWLPDSSGVAYLKHAGPANDLWSVSLYDGAERRMSPFQPAGSFLSVSPDGRYLVSHTPSSVTGMGLLKFELATGRSTDLVNVKGVNAGFGVWSRDGSQIAFELILGEDVRLATVSAEGGPFTEWTTGRGKTWPGSWSADGNTIIAAARREGIWNLYAIGRDHSEKKLTDYTSLREFVRYPRLSPSGDRIIYEYNETKGNIFIGNLLP